MKKVIKFILLMVALPVVALLACGPSFPNAFLNEGSNYLLRAPFTLFHKELTQLIAGQPVHKAIPPQDFHTAQSQSIETDLEDLSVALGKLPMAQEKKKQLYEDYKQARQTLERVRIQQSHNPNRPPHPTIEPGNLLTPAGLPEEFDLYFQGAVAFHKHQHDKARQHWISLLELPPAKRFYKSVWAAFMLGRLERFHDPKKGIDYMQMTRRLAVEGFSDPLGCAAASYGWEARIHLDQGQFLEAIQLYMDQHKTGDPTASSSIRIVIREIHSSPDPGVIKALAQHPDARDLFTAYLISLPYPMVPDIENSVIHLWLDTLDKLDLQDKDLVSRLAVAAYQTGDITSTQHWLAKMDSERPEHHWLSAKLHLRQGHTQAATLHYLKLAPHFLQNKQEKSADFMTSLHLSTYDYSLRNPGNGYDQAAGEWGVLQLASKDYTDALNLFLTHGFWYDAAFVAERVMSLDELKEEIDLKWPHPNPEPELPYWFGEAIPADQPGTDGLLIRYLLGRKLVRNNRHMDALPYFPTAFRPKILKLHRLLSGSNDPDLEQMERAQLLWEAARITRHEGLDLMGTEIQPDFRLHAGQFEYGVSDEARFDLGRWPQAPPTLDEFFRVQSSAPDPDIRFHYRHVAAELGWNAAALMPDQSDETAIVLCTAGSWLKGTHPVKADRFYKALVNRCRNTEIGKRADEIRWFPRLTAKGELIKPPVNAGNNPPQPQIFFEDFPEPPTTPDFL